MAATVIQARTPVTTPTPRTATPATPATTATTRRWYTLAAVLSVAALTAVTYTLIQAPGAGWLSVTTAIRAVISAIGVAAFIVSQVRSDHPMLPVGFFRDRRFAASSGSVTILFFALAGV